MSNFKKIGISLIILGIFIPSVLYPFAKPSRPALYMKIALATKGVQYKPRQNELEIVWKAGEWKAEGKSGHYIGRVAVPYPYFVAAGITTAFLGLAFIVFLRKKEVGHY